MLFYGYIKVQYKFIQTLKSKKYCTEIESKKETIKSNHIATKQLYNKISKQDTYLDNKIYTRARAI